MKNLFILLFASFTAVSAFGQVTAAITTIENTATLDKVRIEYTSTTTLTGADLNPINVWLKIPGDGTGVVFTLTSNPFGLGPSVAFADGGFFYRAFQSLVAQPVGTFPMGTPVTVAEITISGYDGAVELTGGDYAPGGGNFPGTALQQGAVNLISWPLNETASLPITLRDFDVTKKGDDGAKLNWVTSSEENASHFDIERSVDGKEWNKIGEVPAAGNSFTEQYYQFDDSNLKTIPNGDKIFYYRLRSVDFDSQFDYSAVKNIQLDYGDLSINIYPNPTSEGIWVRMSQESTSREDLDYTIVDISGKIVQAGSLGNAADINEHIMLSKEIANGTYMLNINSATQNLRTERVVVIGKK